MADRETGVVKWYNYRKRYGFITRDSGGDVFVHYTGVRGTGHRPLFEGQCVEFEVRDTSRGPIAADVVVLGRVEQSAGADQKGDVRDRETGIVKWFNDRRGFGFITRDSGGDIFVHSSAIRASGYRTLIEGQRVEFSVGAAARGPQAGDVVVLGRAEGE